MKKLSVLAASLVAATSMMSFSAHAEFTPNAYFGGYFRAAISHARSGKAPNQWNNNKVGRLGNESDVYGEAFLGADVLRVKDTEWSVGTRLAYWSENGIQNDEGKFKLDEYFGKIKGLFSWSPDATLWAGRRYYHRWQSEIMDFKLYRVEGTGVGVEYVQVGPGKLSAAWFAKDDKIWDNNYVSKGGKTWEKDTNGNNYVDDNGNYQGYVRTDIVDLEYEFPLWSGANLDLRTSFLIPTKDDKDGWRKNYKLENNISTAKIYAAALGTSHPFGWCNTVVQYFDGSNSTNTFDHGAWLDLSGNSEDAHRWTLANYGDMKFGPIFSLAHSTYFTRGTGFTGDKTDDKAFSFAVRPYVKLTDLTRLIAEVGFFTEDRNYKSGDHVNLQGQKYTLAYAVCPDAGDWKSRPEVRFFVTYLHSNKDEALTNDNLGSYGKTGGTYWSEEAGQTLKLDPITSQFIFGAQIEAWW